MSGDMHFPTLAVCANCGGKCQYAKDQTCQRMVVCPECNGDGRAYHDLGLHAPCPRCHGRRVVLGAAWPCRNCGGPLMPDPLMPEGWNHANGVPLCPGHSTVSSDGSNSARPLSDKDRPEGQR